MLGRLSSGCAAELAGVPRVEFLLNLHRYRVFSLAAELEELEAARGYRVDIAISNTSPLCFICAGSADWRG
ncbi:UPF0175 family protein [Litorilinea aerophila]|uniref:UPF0175 family protein n=1 Tax=Litorilinea aerophila TaxID=1204385 RepID=UPI001B86738B